jgi:hypothetical protein
MALPDVMSGEQDHEVLASLKDALEDPTRGQHFADLLQARMTVRCGSCLARMLPTNNSNEAKLNHLTQEGEACSTVLPDVLESLSHATPESKKVGCVEPGTGNT